MMLEHLTHSERPGDSVLLFFNSETIIGELERNIPLKGFSILYQFATRSIVETGRLRGDDL